MSASDVLNPTQADLKAIYDYVNSRQPDAVKTKNVKALSLIQQFQGWYQNLGPLDQIFDVETLNEAKRRRNDINTALGEAIPLEQVPADNPQQPADTNEWVSKLKKDVSEAPSDIVNFVKIAAVIGGGIILWNLYKATKSEPSSHEESDSLENKTERMLTHGKGT